MKSKKSQLTVFIIIGLIILILTMFILYLRSLKEKELLPELIKTQEIPLELQPVKDFIDACLKQTLTKGIKFIEEHGSYTAQLKTPIPTEANGVELSPGSSYFIPYWYYMESKNECQSNCEFKLAVPPLCKQSHSEWCITSGKNSIEEQLQNYIKDNLGLCLKDFNFLKEQGFIIQTPSEIKVDVKILANKIIAKLDYPIKIKRPSTETTLTSFIAETKSSLSELYEIAHDILNYELTNSFIEVWVWEYLSYFQGIDKELPPISETTIGKPKRIWLLTDVEDKIKKRTYEALSLLGTYNSEIRWPKAEPGPYYHTRQGVLDHSIFFPLKRFHKATITYSYFPWWTPYLDIQPREGMILEPVEISINHGFMGSLINNIIRTKFYEFYYHYSFPVVIEIRKEDEILRFAIEANIRSNAPFTPETSLVTGIGAETLLCDNAQRINPIEIRAIDEYSLEPISNLSVLFIAGETCLLGKTKEGILKTNYPNAYGAIFGFEHNNYLTRFIKQDDIKPKQEIRLKPLKELNLTIKLINESLLQELKKAKTTTQISELKAKASELSKEYIAILHIRREANLGEGELEKNILYFGGKLTKNKIKLTEGSYNITASLVYNKNITLPEEHNRICVKSFVGSCKKVPIDPDCMPRGDTEEDYKNGNCYIKGYKCVEKKLLGLGGCAVNQEIKFNKTTFEAIPIGGLEYNLELDYSTLSKAKNLTIYIFKNNLPTRWWHFYEKINNYKEWSKKYSYIIKPTLR